MGKEEERELYYKHDRQIEELLEDLERIALALESQEDHDVLLNCAIWLNSSLELINKLGIMGDLHEIINRKVDALLNFMSGGIMQ